MVLAWWFRFDGSPDGCPLSGFGASVLSEASRNLQLILPEGRLLVDLQFHLRS